jgi:hypothetical protein
MMKCDALYCVSLMAEAIFSNKSLVGSTGFFPASSSGESQPIWSPLPP